MSARWANEVRHRHSGAMRSIEPGIHRAASCAVKWIPGSRLCRAPGMTVARTTSPCVARRAKHASDGSTRLAKNIPLYRNSETAYVSPQPGPRKRGVSRSSRTRAGRRWTQVTSARSAFAGRATVSEGVAHTTGVTRVRRNRAVLAPGVCAPSLAVMCAAQPDRTHQPSARRRGQ